MPRKALKEYSFLGKIHKKEFMPKVYALYFDSDKAESLHIAVAYTLEEAIEKVTKDKNNFPSMWETLDISKLNEQISFFELKGSTIVSPETKKNDLLQKIIESGDLKTLEKHKGELTTEEQEFVRAKLADK